MVIKCHFTISMPILLFAIERWQFWLQKDEDCWAVFVEVCGASCGTAHLLCSQRYLYLHVLLPWSLLVENRQIQVKSVLGGTLTNSTKVWEGVFSNINWKETLCEIGFDEIFPRKMWRKTSLHDIEAVGSIRLHWPKSLKPLTRRCPTLSFFTKKLGDT